MTIDAFGLNFFRVLCVICALLQSRVCYTQIAHSEPTKPIPHVRGLNEEVVALGDKLFHDPALSRDGMVSCASCHDLSLGGSDRRSLSRGIGGVLGELNAPTVFNISLHFAFFWDGRAQTLEEQMDGPLQNPREMGTNGPLLVETLKKDKRYRAAFQNLYKDGITYRNIKNAIATFQRSLLTPDSRFDQYLKGSVSAISAEEKHGYKLFKSYGCVSCHQGVSLGGNMYQKLGVMNPYFTLERGFKQADLGRFNVTGREKDRFKFKVPSLRNVALTPPYLHDGTAETLEEVVEIMARYQLGRSISELDKKLIVSFLKTLSGSYKGRALEKHDGP